MRAGFRRLGPGRVRLLRERLIYISGGAMSAALVAAIGIATYNSHEGTSQQAYASKAPRDTLELETVILIAPNENVKPGTRMSNVSLREMYWPRDRVPEGAIRSNEDIKGMYSKVDLAFGQPVLRANLSPEPLVGGVADLIPPGYRATTIEVDATSGVEGWATPGAHVDVLLTYQDQNDGMKKTQIAVEDAVVVSYNGQIAKHTTPEAPTRVAQIATVTLAVPVLDAVRIQTARAMGRISLILRNTGDVKSVGTPTVTAQDFQQNQFKKEKSEEETKGYVRFTDANGNQQHLELRSDKRWWAIEQE